MATSALHTPNAALVSHADSTETSAADLSAGSILELLLKDQTRLNELLRDEAMQRVLIPKLLGVSMAGLTIYGVLATAILNLAHHNGFWLPYTPPAFWNGLSIANLTLAYSLGMIAANGICLPSFYFYTLLAGVRTSMVGVVAHALKGMAAGAVMLLGILPIYIALAIYVLVSTESELVLACYVILALALPFVAGLWGAISLYRGFVVHCATLPNHAGGDRACMLRRLILAWSGCYTFVTPLVIYSLWQHLGKILPY